jgi:hypothetical protein
LGLQNRLWKTIDFKEQSKKPKMLKRLQRALKEDKANTQWLSFLIKISNLRNLIKEGIL